MKKIFTEPVINISVFDVENIVTESIGTPQKAADITKENNAIIKADWAAAGDTLTFTF